MDFEINFTDNVLLEANGEYDDAARIMTKPSSNGLVQDIIVKDWVISSDITIEHFGGMARIKADFYHDGKIVITDYVPSNRDMFNPDIRCLKYWSVQYGWSFIEPTQAVIEHMPHFWKNQWDVYLIDSSYLDRQHGERRNLDLDSIERVDDDNEFDGS